MTGASGPKPSIPSWTIVPGAIATSITCEPQALFDGADVDPLVERPGRSGASTRESGLSGNTRPAGGGASRRAGGAGTAGALGGLLDRG